MRTIIKSLTFIALFFFLSAPPAFAESKHLKDWIGTWTVKMNDGSMVTWKITGTWASKTGKSHIAYGIKNPGNIKFQIYLGTMFMKHNYIEVSHDTTVYDLPIITSAYTELVPADNFKTFTARPGKYPIQSGFQGTVESEPAHRVESDISGADGPKLNTLKQPGGKKITPGKAGSVTDIDGNVYRTITIGEQEWMAENLKTLRYRDGTPIEYPGSDNSTWEKNTEGAYAWHNNDIENKDTYGALYNWNAVTSSRGLCPVDWHVPTDAEWQTLVDYLGGGDSAGGEMKSTRKEPGPHPRWNNPNTGATNAGGFSGLPAGLRRSNGTFRDIGLYGAWWSTTNGTETDAWHRSIFYIDTTVYHFIYGKGSGMSIRCVRD
jgi:uncharacterized protein (TIGR02145 family)